MARLEKEVKRLSLCEDSLKRHRINIEIKSAFLIKETRPKIINYNFKTSKYNLRNIDRTSGDLAG